MKIEEKIGSLNKNCEICIQGKFSQSRNRQSDRRAASNFELIHTDLAGPIVWKFVKELVILFQRIPSATRGHVVATIKEGHLKNIPLFFYSYLC